MELEIFERGFRKRKLSLRITCAVLLPIAVAGIVWGLTDHTDPQMARMVALGILALPLFVGLFIATPPERTRPRGTDQYFAQFVGITRDGQPLIHANFFCDDFGMDWRSDIVIVCDGGSCFFSVEYDPATGAYQNLMINGEA